METTGAALRLPMTKLSSALVLPAAPLPPPTRSSSKVAFVALHMSANGTKRTCRTRRSMSAFGG